MRTALYVAVIVSCGCGEPVEPQHLASSGAIAEWQRRLEAPSPKLIVLVVDDRDDPAARELRLTVRDALRESLVRFVAGSPCAWDPASWHPVHWELFVVLPSRPPTERIVGADQVPAFSVQADQFDETTASALADAAHLALESRLAAPGAAFLPLDAASDALAVVIGSSEPMSTGEIALREASLRQPLEVHLAIAVARDDGDTLAVADYPLVPQDGASLERRVVELVVVAPFASSQACRCELAFPETLRVTQWAEHAAERGYAPCVSGWPCVEEPLDSLFRSVEASAICPGLCATRPIALEPSERAQCTVAVKSYDGACDPARGWTAHPDGTGVDERGAYRVCRLRQLEGAALDACRHTLACKGCESGFCQTLVPELERSCFAGEHDAGLRFVGGAVAGAEASLDVSCALAD